MYASNFLGEALFYCLRVDFFSRSNFYLKCVGYDRFLILETHLLPPGFEDLFIFPLCCRLAIFNYLLFYFIFTVVSSCHVSFSTVCTLKFIWTIISFFTCVVLSSAFSTNYFSSASCFCVSVFSAIMTHHGSVLVRVYSCTRWLSGGIESTFLFLQIEGEEYCCSVRVPRLDESRFNSVFEEWERFL